jgi:hypothetical protein
MSLSIRSLSAAGLLAVVAGSANATLFSFASDVNDQLPTFVGSAGAGGTFAITDAGATNRTTLVIDDDNGLAPSVSITNTRFVSNLTASWVASNVLFGTLVQHTYSVSGSFGFVDAGTGAALLTASLGASAPSLFSVPGTATSWSTVGAVLGSSSFANITYTVTNDLLNRVTAAGQNPVSYNLVAGPSSGSAIADFGFDLSVLTQTGSSLAVQLNPNTRLPTTGWGSEGSYSGSVGQFIPAPGSVALLALGGLLAVRRRRN